MAGIGSCEALNAKLRSWGLILRAMGSHEKQWVGFCVPKLILGIWRQGTSEEGSTAVYARWHRHLRPKAEERERTVSWLLGVEVSV